MPTDDKISFLDLIAPHLELEEELANVFRVVLHSASFIGGPMVKNFEQDFAAFCNTEHAVAVSSGTDALRFALIAAGIGAGEVVITVPNTFIATTEAISQAGAIPEFVDVDESTYNMSVDALRKYIEKHCTRDRLGRLISRRYEKVVSAIVPVHLYGQMADMDGIAQIAEENNLTIIEDACQAHGAEYFSRRANSWVGPGSIGRAAAFSFYPGKNLGACGEGGAVTTNCTSIAEKITMLRDHGQKQKYYHTMEGYNGRLDALQAGLLSVKMRHLQNWNWRRRQLASAYNHLLVDVDSVICPYEPSWSRAVYHLYVVRTHDREDMISHLKGAGIETGIHYPTPLHLQQAYTSLGYQRGDFPVTERAAAEIVSLPMFPQLTTEQIARVAHEVSTFAQAGMHKRTRKAEMVPSMAELTA